jgi:transposase-like protein
MSYHTKSFKLQIVKNYESSLFSYSTLSEQYKLSSSSLKKWVYGYKSTAKVISRSAHRSTPQISSWPHRSTINIKGVTDTAVSVLL